MVYVRKRISLLVMKSATWITSFLTIIIYVESGIYTERRRLNRGSQPNNEEFGEAAGLWREASPSAVAVLWNSLFQFI